MANKLKQYFPMIRTRAEVLEEISSREALLERYRGWTGEQKEEFLDFCSGNRGVKILYDSFFKEIMSPETAPERLEEFLTLLLGQNVKILRTLPNDSSRLADENSLVIMDIIVELEDHSIANVEVQKLGYMFPGQRSACYSADLLLRQYKRVRGEKGKAFSYKDIKKVYTIVLYEKSPRQFSDFPDNYVHHFSHVSDTGLQMDLLQEYVFVALDIFKKAIQNRDIRNRLEAWLFFLATDDPEDIGKLLERYPEFGKLYREIYEICRNVEKVMEMFSMELWELDRNTVQYMMDEMQEELDALKQEKEEVFRELTRMREETADVKKEVAKAEEEKVRAEEEKKKMAEEMKEAALSYQKELAQLKARLAELESERGEKE